MDGGQKVWAPHGLEGYQLGLIVDVGADTLTVQPLEKSEQVGLLASVARACYLVSTPASGSALYMGLGQLLMRCCLMNSYTISYQMWDNVTIKV